MDSVENKNNDIYIIQNKNNAGSIIHNGRKYPKVYHGYPLWSDMKYRESRDGLPFSGPYSAFTPGKPLESRSSAASHTASSDRLDDSRFAEEKVDELSQSDEPSENIQNAPKSDLEDSSFFSPSRLSFSENQAAKRRSNELVDEDINSSSSKKLKQM